MVAVELNDGPFGLSQSFIDILYGHIFPGPSDGLRLHPTVFFSSDSGLTADSSVLTLTLAFLDFGLDFAQSFPFHAHNNNASKEIHVLLARSARSYFADLNETLKAVCFEQLIEARVSAALANHDTLRNSTNGHGDGSQQSVHWRFRELNAL
ncbi:hypothetical protein Tco_0120958 [Tanacetum coccineum]